MTHDQEVATTIVIGHLRSEGIPPEDWAEMIHDELRDTPYKVTPEQIKDFLLRHQRILLQLSVSTQRLDSLQ